MNKKHIAIIYLVTIVFLAVFSLAHIYCGMKNIKEYKKQKVVLISYQSQLPFWAINEEDNYRPENLGIPHEILEMQKYMGLAMFLITNLSVCFVCICFMKGRRYQKKDEELKE